MSDIENTVDLIDVRDVIARVEHLEKLRQPGPVDLGDDNETDQDSLFLELDDLSNLLEALKGMGGGEQWRGDWYPVTLIRDSYFEDAMDELLEDIGALQPFEERPCYIQITVDYDALKMDYSSVEYGGVTYWTR